MQSLLLLHGAIGSAAQLEGLSQKLSAHFMVHNLTLPGHGGKGIPEAFSISFFADFVRKYCEENQLTRVSIFGYSMGGYIGLYLARHYPYLVDRVITLATKFQWNEEIAGREVKMLQPEVIIQKLPDFAKTLELRHGAQQWRQVLAKTAEMLLLMGLDSPLKGSDLQNISVPCLIMEGDRDKMVDLQEAIEAYKKIPGAQLSILPSTKHAIEDVDIDLLFYMIRSFLCK